MQPHEQAQFLSAVAEFVKLQVAVAVQPYQEKIEALEAKIAAIPAIDQADIVEEVHDVVVKNLPPPKEVDMTRVAELVEHERAQTGEALMRISDTIMRLMQQIEQIPATPLPLTKEQVIEIAGDLVTKTILENKELGLLADFDEVVSKCGGMVHELRNEVATLISALPVPKDGADGKDGRDGADGEPGVPGADGKDGEDGKPLDFALVKIAIAGLIEERFMNYPVSNGKDGAPGKDGADGKDGRDGTNGVDGTSVSLDDLVGTCRDLVAEA